ncbi:hypothetical protein [Nocardia cyriacigeorgica]|uniref:hypothetical protein n=1 Tax=Nocardia cyriacigeorgica TaxID=135487 RepID=UPI001894128C|nr:hypothetical protein [Nocardia cyriacigeorgica]MBF6416917.1 hypothetical protein [Nocardia cyriacigeorgica]
MHSTHIDPDTGAKLRIIAETTVTRSTSIEVGDDASDLMLGDLRMLVANCADLPDDAIISARVGGMPLTTSVLAILVRHRQITEPPPAPGSACPGGDACVCPDPAEVEQ